MVTKIDSSKFGKTLQMLRKQNNLSQEKLAEVCELDRTYISMLERGLKNPSLPTLMKISDAFNIRVDQMMTKLYQEDSKLTNEREVALPFMGTSSSSGSSIGNNQYIKEEISLDKMFLKHPKDTFFVRGHGDAMRPTISPNDLLIINRKLRPKNNQIVLAQYNDKFTVKRFLKYKDRITLQADNPSYPSLEFHDERDLVICGVVISIIRTF